MLKTKMKTNVSDKICKILKGKKAMTFNFNYSYSKIIWKFSEKT